MTAFVHPQALVETDQIGDESRVWAFAHIMAGAVVGAGCNIGDHAFIESGAVVGNRVTIKNAVLIWDGVTLEDEVFVGPNAVFTNVPAPRVAFKPERSDFVPTLVKTGASIGANTTVVCGVTIGRYAMIGAGAVVNTDVLDHALLVGNPARQIGWACTCGATIPESLLCDACGRRFERLTYGLAEVDAAS